LSAATGNAQANFAGTQTVAASLSGDLAGGFAVDPEGNVYICDQSENLLEESAFSAGTYGPLTLIFSGICQSVASPPTALAVDAAGNIYYSNGSQILKLSKVEGGYTGPSVVAAALSNPLGIALDPAGNVFIADTGNSRVVVAGAYPSGYLPLATVLTGLSGVLSVAVDGQGSVYAGGGYGDATGYVVKTFWNGTFFETPQTLLTGFSYLTGITADSIGDVFVSTDDNYANPAIGDSGPGAVVNLWEIPVTYGPALFSPDVYGPPIPIGQNLFIAKGAGLDAAGNVYVLWIAANEVGFAYNVEKIQPQYVSFGAVPVGSSAQQQVTFWVDGTETVPPSVTVSTDGVTGKDFTTAGGVSCNPDTGIPLNLDGYPVACGATVTFTPAVSGARTGTALLVSGSSGNPIASVYLTGAGAAPQTAFDPGTVTTLESAVSGALGTAVDEAGNVYIADSNHNQVLKLPWTGSGYGAPILIGTGLSEPTAVAVDGFGNVYINDSANNRIVKEPWTGSGYGTQIVILPPSGVGISSLAVDSAGDVFYCVQDGVSWLPWLGSGYGQTESVVTGHGGDPSLDAIQGAASVAVDANRNVYIADIGNNRIAKVPWSQGVEIPVYGSPEGSFLSVNGYPGYGSPVTAVAGLNGPTSVAIDGNGNLYIGDYNNNRVATSLWNGSSYGPPTTVVAGLNGVEGVSVDGSGSVYASDYGNNRIVKVNRSKARLIGFEATAIGHTSADSPQTVTVENIGNRPLDFSSLTYPKDFPESPGDENACTAESILTAGLGCDFPIQFTPTVSGALNETVLFTDNNLNLSGTIQAINVSASQPPPAPMFSPASGEYAPSQTITITDTVPGAAIFYTTNGSTPTEASIPYSGPIPISQNLNLSAIAVVNGVSSAITSGTYTVFDSQIQVLLSSTTFAYPGSTIVTVRILPGPDPFEAPTGTVQLVLDGHAVSTPLVLSGAGYGNAAAYYYLKGVSAGPHNLSAIYSGGGSNPAGSSLPVPFLVLPEPVKLDVSCQNPTLVHGASYKCEVYTGPVAAGDGTVFTYKYDSEPAVAVFLSGGFGSFSIPAPAIGPHSVSISYVAQENFAAASSVVESFTVVAP